jgi:hypothetical protein
VDPYLFPSGQVPFIFDGLTPISLSFHTLEKRKVGAIVWPKQVKIFNVWNFR